MPSKPRSGSRSGGKPGARPGDAAETPSREELLARHAEARHRRNAAELGGPEWEAASEEVGRIEIEIARIERSLDPPRV
jgi:hypothetical protein